MNHPFPWLRYLAADQIQGAVSVKGWKVRNGAGEELGKVDGFIVDSNSLRPYYLVVNAGGWFKSKQFLVPIAYTDLSADPETLQVDLSKDRIRRFPGFDKQDFDKLTESDIQQISNDIYVECRVAGITTADEEDLDVWERPAYQTPDWWESVPSRPDRMGGTGLSS